MLVTGVIEMYSSWDVGISSCLFCESIVSGMLMWFSSNFENFLAASDHLGISDALDGDAQNSFLSWVVDEHMQLSGTLPMGLASSALFLALASKNFNE